MREPCTLLLQKPVFKFLQTINSRPFNKYIIFVANNLTILVFQRISLKDLICPQKRLRHNWERSSQVCRFRKFTDSALMGFCTVKLYTVLYCRSLYWFIFMSSLPYRHTRGVIDSIFPLGRSLVKRVSEDTVFNERHKLSSAISLEFLFRLFKPSFEIVQCFSRKWLLKREICIRPADHYATLFTILFLEKM